MRKFLVPVTLALVVLVGVVPAEARGGGGSPAPKNTFTFAKGSYSIGEGNGTNPVIQINITRSTTSGTASVNFSADSGTASGDTFCDPQVDYIKKSNVPVSFSDGQKSAPVSLTTCGDMVYEGNEVVTLRLDSPSDGYGIANKSSEPLTIVDNESVPAITIDNPSANEGTAMGFTIKLSTPAQNGVSVDFATADGSATTPEDYGPNSGTITWAPYTNADVARFAPTRDDGKYGLGEWFAMNLSNAVGGTILTPSGTGTIIEGNPKPNININTDARAWEGGTLHFTATLSAVSEVPTTFDWKTYDGTALAGICGDPGDNDYTAGSGHVTIPAGSLTSAPGDIDVVTCQDPTPEPNQSLGVFSLNGVNGIPNLDGAGVIKDDEPASMSIVNTENYANGNFDSRWLVANTDGNALNGVLVRFEDYHTTGFGYPYFDGVDLTGPGKAAFDYTGDNVATTGGPTLGDEGDGIATLRAPVEPGGQYDVQVACVTTTFDTTESACGAVTPSQGGGAYDGSFSIVYPTDVNAPNLTTAVQLFPF